MSCLMVMVIQARQKILALKCVLLIPWRFYYFFSGGGGCVCLCVKMLFIRLKLDLNFEPTGIQVPNIFCF